MRARTIPLVGLGTSSRNHWVLGASGKCLSSSYVASPQLSSKLSLYVLQISEQFLLQKPLLNSPRGSI